MTKLFVIIAFLAFFVSCAESGLTKSQYQLVKAFPNINIVRPVDIQSPDDGTNRIFVLQQSGKIHVFKNDSNVIDQKIFLDITDRVDSRGNEEGLLGLAFHPDFKNNGYFYVNYTATSPDRTVIARFSVSKDDPMKADSASELVLLEYSQPYSNHNGGQVMFGPDGYLYIAVGDGGSGGDPHGNGQNRSTLLGSILRIDVNKKENEKNYAIPADNPFANSERGFRGEIFAYGLRNPWRFCFEPATGWLWAGDVGQNKYEEVDIIKKGQNYGWNIMEGLHCYNPESHCDQKGLVLPIIEYDHSVGNSITGGYFYQNGPLKELIGSYIYGDFVTGKIWALKHEGETLQSNTLIIDKKAGISSFGLDADKNLYALIFDGFIYKLAEK